MFITLDLHLPDMPDQREKIIGFVKNNGPVLPVQLSKYLDTNILFASAMLSELFSSKHIKMTHASIGGSPLYYLQGQEVQVDARLSTSLSGREKEIYNLLKEKKVLREKDLVPWQRIAVKQLPDFAVSVNVKYGTDEDVFWKHQLVNEEDAKNAIANILNETLDKKHAIADLVSSVKKEIPVTREPLAPFAREIRTPKSEEISGQQTLGETGKPENVLEKAEKLRTRKVKKTDTGFYENTIKFLKNNNIQILKEEVVKKNKEINFIVSINSPFGDLKYLVKAKSKASITEADISMAYSDGQLKKMPVIMLVDGNVGKRAMLFAEGKMQGQLTLKKI